ncbi:MAG TPA: hypothetical protein VGO48_12825 [Conexibacter sp.]|nr:hypothetical protein [Conexibacter sp.]
MTVAEFLRLAPFSLGTITILLAAGGLLFGHAYGRYGDDAAISFLLRWRFVAAAAFVVPGPALMLVSFGRGEVPSWLSSTLAAGLIGVGIGATILVVVYLIVCVSRPGMFLASVGKRVTVPRVNRYAQARRWRQDDEFSSDLAAREYRWIGFGLSIHGHEVAATSRSRRACWVAVKQWMKLHRWGLRFYRTDPSEMLFDAAAAGLKNGNMRTWRSALEVVGRRLQSRKLDAAAAEVVVANAHALEEFAHRQGSEDCKIRLCAALGEIGGVRLKDESATIVARGISTLAERRLVEHGPVLAAIEALQSVSTRNPTPAVRTAGWLGQHLANVPPPVAVYGFDGERLDHPTRALFALLNELAERAATDDDGQLNDVIIDACAMISRSLPGQQDRETINTLTFALSRAGIAAARHYGADEEWHGIYDAVTGLLRLHEAISQTLQHAEDDGNGPGIAEEIATIGCRVIANTKDVGLTSWNGRSDMAVVVADQLLKLPKASVGKAFVELLVRQHNSHLPSAQRDAFIALCQRMTGDLLGLRRFLDEREDDRAPFDEN